MIIVFANEHDEHAKSLVRRWTDREAVLMTPSDLSHAGWYCTSSEPSHSKYVAGGIRHDSSEIQGVLIRWTAVIPADLPHIIPSNRIYVASEMTASLLYWLTSLDCPVLNRPTPRSLCGPGWYPEHWIYHAASVGLHVKPMERSVKLRAIEHSSWPAHDGPCTELTIVGENCFGDAAPDLKEKCRALAAKAGVHLVKFRFHDPCFLEADLCPTLDDERVEQAVLSYLA